jgi:hypothetical protein
MEAGNMGNGAALNLSVDERNGKLASLLSDMRVAGKFEVGDVVESNNVGACTGMFVAGERFFVAACGEVIGKFAGDPSRTVELWSFDSDGLLKRTITDPRFIRLVESSKPIRKAAVKAA